MLVRTSLARLMAWSGTHEGDGLCQYWTDEAGGYVRCLEPRVDAHFCVQHRGAGAVRYQPPVPEDRPPMGRPSGGGLLRPQPLYDHPPVPAAPREPPAPTPLEALQREVELAEQMHRQAVLEAQRRKAVAVKKARAAEQRQALQRARDAEAVKARADEARMRRARQLAEAVERAQWKEVGKLSDETAHRRIHEAHDTYAVNFLETYVDDAYYLDAIEPYTWR